MRLAFRFIRGVGRTVILVFLVAAGTILLMRLAPGYFSDAREIDAKYGQEAESHLTAEQAEHGSLRALAFSTFEGYVHGDLGRSRQYDVPVRDLVLPRFGVTASLLARGIAYAWGIAFCVALPVSAARRFRGLFAFPSTLLLAVPTGAMATVCLVSNHGGPVMVLVLVLASRDFKFLQRAFLAAWNAPHLLVGRAQGMRLDRLALVHVLPNVLPHVRALATLSLVIALSAIVPIEVIFDLHGIGQLAWTAAMNRDLPVLIATTMLMACVVALAGTLSQRMRSPELA